MIGILLVYGLIGVVAGFLGGLLGIAGGLITVPALLFFFNYLHFPPESTMHLALGTSLASMVITAYASTRAHQARGAVLWEVLGKMTPGLVIGSILGPFIARQLTSDLLQYIFAIFILLLGIYLLLHEPKASNNNTHLPPGPIFSLIALFIGGLSSILGLGGGLLTVPALIAFRVNVKKAVGTAAASGLVVSLIAAISYVYFGMGKEVTKLSFGYIYLPAFVMLSVATFITAPFGAGLAHFLPALMLRRIFGSVLIATAILMALMALMN
jgi:uncharacterized membrane protein YfcA